MDYLVYLANVLANSSLYTKKHKLLQEIQKMFYTRNTRDTQHKKYKTNSTQGVQDIKK